MRTVLRLVLLGAMATACLAATTSVAAAACPNESLRYGYGAYLPDCRAYEQATPIEKDGTDPQTSFNAVQAATNGGGITFFSEAGVPGATAATQVQIFLATRGADGWSTQGLQPPATLGQSTKILGWTPDLRDTFGTAYSYQAKEITMVARETSGSTIQTILPHTPIEFVEFKLVGASANGAIVYFEEAEGNRLTAEAVEGKDNLYAWDRSTGTLSLAGVLPDTACGTPPCTPAGGSIPGGYDWAHNRLTNGGAHAHYPLMAEHATSEDGQKAYFTAGETGQLYLREHATSAGASTVHVSASQKTNGSGPGGTDPNGPQPAAFMMATPDGSQAFFTSPEELTNNATTGAADEGNDLYRYDATTGALTDLTPDTADPNGAEVAGVLGTSGSGSSVYFVANGDLDGSGPATPGNCSLVDGHSRGEGECSVYLWHEGTITFVARLDASGSVEGEATNSSDAFDWLPKNNNTSRVSADGNVLVFRSQSKLTAYENAGVPEYYRYEAQTGRLACITCNPSGTPATVLPVLQGHTSFAHLPSPPPIQTRNLSSSGDQFFFETSEALLPTDTNNAPDVYEWEADGAGSCRSSADGGGCLYLLSTGKNPDGANFGDASTSGEDAFIFTDQPLVGQDEGELVDVYDVRVNGGLASQRGQSAPPCTGEGCKSSPPAALAAAPPGSLTFTGAGNKKPQVRQCASIAKRGRNLGRRAKKLDRRVKKLHRRIQGLWHRGKRHRAQHIRREARRLRHEAHRLHSKATNAIKQAKKCRGGSGRAAK